MPQRIIAGEEELRSLVGQEVGVSEWVELRQERIQQFAEATGDYQWIHLDADRAAAESPYGRRIAHGFLTLSLLSMLSGQTFRIDAGFKLAVNYGLNRVRFPAPVFSGSRIRARFTLGKLEEIAGGLQFIWNVVVESEGGEKPCLAAEWVTRAYR